MGRPTKGKRPRRQADPRLMQLERSLAASLPEEVRRRLARHIRAGDKSLVEVAAAHPVPDQIAPDFAFRPAVPAPRRRSGRGA